MLKVALSKSKINATVLNIFLFKKRLCLFGHPIYSLQIFLKKFA